MTKMDNGPLKMSPIGQLYSESISETKSRFLQNGSPSVSRAEVICPRPRRATSVPYMFDSLNRLGGKVKGNMPLRRGSHLSEIFDVILTKDELEDAGNNQIGGFLCGSPPVRTNNPVVHDAEFAKLTHLSASPLGNSLGMKLPRHDKGSPSCGSPLGASPKVRIEGFACGSPESPRVVPALA